MHFSLSLKVSLRLVDDSVLRRNIYSLRHSIAQLERLGERPERNVYYLEMRRYLKLMEQEAVRRNLELSVRIKKENPTTEKVVGLS